jgi:hypothetical protein
VVGFLSVSTAADRETNNAVVSLVNAAQAHAQRLGRRMEPPWCVRFVRGREAATADSAEIRRWIHRNMVRDVDFLLAVVYGVSDGCWTEVQWASELGIPTSIAVPAGRDACALAGSVAGRGRVKLIVFEDHADFVRQWTAWLRRNEHRIAKGDTRRAAPLPQMEPLRLACVAAWNDCDNAEREQVALAMDMAREDLVELLTDRVDFASSCPEVRRELGTELGVAAVAMFDLSHRFVSSFRIAVAERQIDDHTANEVLREGLRYEQRRFEQVAMGRSLRKAPLTNHAGWNRIIDDVCRRLDS